jgi:redox-sensitive bicupin YhaK (pirin superfamily)
MNRQVACIYAPNEFEEEKGVMIYRSIGGERLAVLDPIILLDHVKTAPGSGKIGFSRHPHRGIETVSVVVEGEVGHSDSLGNEGFVGPDGTQWMNAGNGIWHEEMLIPGPEGGEMMQLWFSLPRAKKRVQPTYQNGPVVPFASGVRVIAGRFGGVEGLFQGISVQPTILVATLEANAALTIPTEADEAAFAYVFRGSATIEGKTANAPEMMILTGGDETVLTAGPDGARVLFVSAKPLEEPILQYRSFVMNTAEDICETVEMIEAGTFAA